MQSSPPSQVIAPPGPPSRLDPIETRIPSSLMDLVASFEVCKQRGRLGSVCARLCFVDPRLMPWMTEHSPDTSHPAVRNDLFDPQSVAMLEQSFNFVPECSDAER
jgi:hypothetical protein